MCATSKNQISRLYFYFYSGLTKSLFWVFWSNQGYPLGLDVRVYRISGKRLIYSFVLKKKIICFNLKSIFIEQKTNPVNIISNETEESLIYSYSHSLILWVMKAAPVNLRPKWNLFHSWFTINNTDICIYFKMNTASV